MALSLKTNRSLVSSKLAGAILAIFALFVQPLVSMNIPAAFAIGLTVSETAFEVQGSSSRTSEVSAAGYGSLNLSFEYNAEKLDESEKLLYGWRAAGGADHQLGHIVGKNESTNNPKLTDETGSLHNIELPTEANDNQLELYFTNNGNSSEDTVEISDISLEGSALGEVNVENFNTVDGNYKGISVGFNASNFGTVTDVTVTLYRASGGPVIKVGNQGVKDLISNKAGPVQLTAPFIIQEVDFTEESDSEYWQPAPAIWNESTIPTRASITVTDIDGKTDTAVNSMLSQEAPSHPTYQSLLPAPTVQMCPVVSSAAVGSLGEWNTSETRTTGHNEMTENGLHVWTEGATSTDKAAAYKSTDILLKDIGEVSMEYIQLSGGYPGFQLAIDKEADGTGDGYLVGEPNVPGYGTSWWASKDDNRFGLPSGMGYQDWGTLNDYLAVWPNAKITAIGYSLGSGVQGDGMIKSMTAGCVKYVFASLSLDIAPPAVSNISVSPLVNGRNTGGNAVVVTFDMTDATGVDFNKTYVMFADGPGTSNQLKESAKIKLVSVPGGSGHRYSATFDTYQFVKANWTGTYNLQFTRVDTLGNRSTSKPLKVFVDNSGPTSTLTTPESGSLMRGVKRFTFTVSDDSGVKSGYVKLNGPITRQVSLVEGDGGVWYADIDTRVLVDGNYTIDARFIDVFNTARYGAIKGAVSVDNTAPDATIVFSPEIPRTDDTIVVTGSVVEELNIKAHWFEITRPNGSMYYEYVMNTTEKSFSFSLDTSGGAGKYKVRYVATDRAGNRSDSEGATTATITVSPVPINTGTPVGGDEESEQGGSTSSSSTGTQNNSNGQIFQNPIVPQFSTFTQGNTLDDSAQEVSAEEVATDNDKAVLGSQVRSEGTQLRNTAAVDLEGEGFELLGFSWKWWIGGLVALIAGWLLLAAIIRRARRAEA